MKKEMTDEIGWIVILNGQIHEFELWSDAIEMKGELMMTKVYYTYHWLPTHETK